VQLPEPCACSVFRCRAADLVLASSVGVAGLVVDGVVLVRDRSFAVVFVVLLFVSVVLFAVVRVISSSSSSTAPSPPLRPDRLSLADCPCPPRLGAVIGAVLVISIFLSSEGPFPGLKSVAASACDAAAKAPESLPCGRFPEAPTWTQGRRGRRGGGGEPLSDPKSPGIVPGPGPHRPGARHPRPGERDRAALRHAGGCVPFYVQAETDAVASVRLDALEEVAPTLWSTLFKSDVAAAAPYAREAADSTGGALDWAALDQHPRVEVPACWGEHQFLDALRMAPHDLLGESP